MTARAGRPGGRRDDREGSCRGGGRWPPARRALRVLRRTAAAREKGHARARGNVPSAGLPRAPLRRSKQRDLGGDLRQHQRTHDAVEVPRVRAERCAAAKLQRPGGSSSGRRARHHRSRPATPGPPRAARTLTAGAGADPRSRDRPDRHPTATLRELPLGTSGADECSQKSSDEAVVRELRAWCPTGRCDGNTDSPATIWRVPPGGRPPRPLVELRRWLGRRRLRHGRIGCCPTTYTLLVSQAQEPQSQRQPVAGACEGYAITADGLAGADRKALEEITGDLPDGFAVRKGRQRYLAAVGLTAQLVEDSTRRARVARFPTVPHTDNGSRCRSTTPSGCVPRTYDGSSPTRARCSA